MVWQALVLQLWSAALQFLSLRIAFLVNLLADFEVDVVVEVHFLVVILVYAARERVQVLEVAHVAGLEEVLLLEALLPQLLPFLVSKRIRDRVLLAPLVLDESLLVFISQFVDALLLPFLVQIEQVQRVTNHVLLDVVVEWRVGGEAGAVVDFKQPWLAVAVQEDICSKDLEAERVVQVTGLRRFVDVLDFVNSA